MKGLRDRLAELGYEWQEYPPRNPIHPFLTAKRVGELVFVSGQVPIDVGLMHPGRVNEEVSVDDAARAAEVAALNCIYAVGAVVEPDDIVGVVDLTVFVRVSHGFTDTSLVANGASNFLISVFGEAGEHARAAIGVAELPLGASVEIKAVFQVRG